MLSLGNTQFFSKYYNNIIIWCIALATYLLIMLTYLIHLWTVESIDQGRECNGINYWPCCFVVSVSEVESQLKSEFIFTQAISKVIT